MSVKQPCEPFRPRGVGSVRRLLHHRPRRAFMAMVIILVLSTGISFLYPQHRPRERIQSFRPKAGFQQGYDRMVQGIQTLGLTWGLQQEVNGLIAKDSLSHADSLQLRAILNQLEMIHQQFNLKQP